MARWPRTTGRFSNDDKKAFGSYQACIMVRQDVLAEEPRLKPALDELSGKFTNEEMRKLDAAVDVDHRAPSDVAAEFLNAGRAEISYHRRIAFIELRPILLKEISKNFEFGTNR